MRITDLLSKDGIELNVNAKDKNDIINKMTKLMLKRFDHEYSTH